MLHLCLLDMNVDKHLLTCKSDVPLNWFMSYLTGASLVLGNASSFPARLFGGVPQGCILGPLFIYHLHATTGGKSYIHIILIFVGKLLICICMF